MKKKRKRGLLLLLCMAVLFCTKTLPAKAAFGFTEDIVGGMDIDEETGLFRFVSVDKIKTSHISYTTLGFTIHRCVPGTDTPYPYEAGNYIKLNLLDLDQAVLHKEVSFDKDKTKVVTIWLLSEDYILDAIQRTNAEWFDEVDAAVHGESLQKICLEFNAIMTTAVDGEKEGRMNKDNSFQGKVYGVTPETKTVEDLKHAYGWADPNGIDTHFHKTLQWGKVKPPEDVVDPPAVTAPAEDFVKRIGKDTPAFVTWNDSRKFDIGLGIPSTEILENGVEADGWYGTVDVGKHTRSKNYNIPYTVTWEESTWVDRDNDGEKDEDEIGSKTLSRNGWYTVSRSYAYYYIMQMSLYDFLQAEVTNDAYPADTIDYIGKKDRVKIATSVNGVADPEIVYSWYPDDAKHVNFPTVDTGRISIAADSFSAGFKTVKKMAESRVPAKFTVRNDSVVINGITYMDAVPTTSPKEVRDVAEGDYATEKFEKSVKIPFNVANGDYETALQVTYEKKAVNNQNQKKHKKTGKDAIKDGPAYKTTKRLKENEPVFVHTPVVSPAEIIDPETGEKLGEEDQQTQLEEENSRYVDYQLLLEGTYTFRFDEEMHREIEGYGEGRFDQYTLKKEIQFPFDVLIQDVWYEKGTWLGQEEGVSFDSTEFYIPSFAEETKYGEILCRVSALNVDDENGNHHEEDTEDSANLDPKNYVATYKIPIQLSGRIYNFQVVGTTDRDMFESAEKANENPNHVQCPFCPSRQEKKSGNKNRVGGDWIRYTKDGTVTKNWDKRDVLPLASGSSHEYTGMGALWKGTWMYFTVKTMANLWDETGDGIVITPTFRYVSKEGEVKENIKVYYHNYYYNDSYVEVGSERDKKRINTVCMGDDAFANTWYDTKTISDTTSRSDLDYTVKKHNEWTKDNYTRYAWMEREADSYSIGRIDLNAKLRLLTGNVEELERNLNRQGENLLPLDLPEEEEDRFRYSMQTWYGTYWIPNDLFVAYDDVDLYKMDYVEEDGDYWMKDGYLIVNFDIHTVNNKEKHLRYFGGTDNQWKKEGAKKEIPIGIYQEISVPARDGDVAVIELEHSQSSKWKPGIIQIN